MRRNDCVISAGFIIVLLGVLLIPSAVAESEQVPYCGDIDGSHAVGSDDLNYFVAYLWLGGPPPPSMLEANFGGCAGVDIHDLVSLVNRFFGNGDPHCEDTAVCVSEIQGAVSLDGVTPMPSPGVLVAGSTVRFGIRLTNSSDQNIVAISNGFRVYSPDGAVWSATIPLLTEEMQEYWYTGFDGGVFACSLNTDGNDADTVAVGGWSLFRAGLSPESELAALTIDIGPIADEAIGKHICIDSCWHRPAGIWAWQQWSFWRTSLFPHLGRPALLYYRRLL